MKPDASDVTVLVADDSPLIRVALSAVLDAEPDLRVVAVACSADEAIRLAATHRPDVAILDVHMPGNGLTAASGIQRVAPGTRLIAFTGDADALSPPDLARLGIFGFLVKGVTNAEVTGAVRAAAGSRGTGGNLPD